jgi:hypothetical protein
MCCDRYQPKISVLPIKLPSGLAWPAPFTLLRPSVSNDKPDARGQWMPFWLGYASRTEKVWLDTINVRGDSSEVKQSLDGNQGVDLRDSISLFNVNKRKNASTAQTPLIWPSCMQQIFTNTSFLTINAATTCC